MNGFTRFSTLCLQQWDSQRIRFMCSPLIPDYTLYPLKEHKRKRIQKKWLKRYGYKPNDQMCQVGGTIICSKLQWDILKNLEEE